MLLTFNWEGWDKESAQRYNTLLNTEILPTRFGHNETLAALGLDTDVFETLNAMGIAPLCYLKHELYPDLVRQALATAQIGYDNPQAPTYENCSFSFMVDGKFCSLSLDQVNEIYEISDERKDVAVENKFTLTERIIRLPKGVSVPDQKPYVEGNHKDGLQPPFCEGSNLKGRQRITADAILRTENKKDRCGSLLTPLFKHYGINLQAYAVNYNIDSIENIRFLPDPKFLCADPGAPLPDDDMDELEDITPDEETAYDLGPLDDDADEAAYRRWMVDSQRRNNSLMKRNLKAITGLCFGGQEPQPSAAEETPQQSHRPDKEPAGSSARAERIPRNRRTAVGVKISNDRINV
ncbi:hypothetical protein F2Q68_00035216 [Brassica cretica]|uniref:Arabidopsis retrotransposon Orf1 C-terminal domain-containing protein n=1 Tax=Brassica cretica TaxID=69181 RepID=A0A8S9H9I6_BRACR|nr:hypothetical protein F2Q68_00035216 [Brassica cretica]